MSLYRFMIVFFVWLLISFQPVFSQALPKPTPEPERVTRAISGVLQQGMQRRGFAANDHRFMNTVARTTPGLSTVAGSTAAAVTIGAVTAPAWATVAIAAGIGAVVTYAISLGLDALVNWFFRDDGLIDQSSDMAGDRDPSSGITPGVPAWRATVWTDRYTSHEAWGGDGYAMAKQSYFSRKSVWGETPDPNIQCRAHSATNIFCELQGAVLDMSGPPNQCAKGTFFATELGCAGYSFPVENVVDDRDGLTPQEAIEALPEEVLAQPLNPALLAGLANRAWQQAASEPGYDGLPYPQSNPLTAEDAAPWLQANPELAPTVRDFVSPNPVTNDRPNPWALPSNPTASRPTPAIPNSNTSNPGAENPVTNLGPDPGIGAPTLETIPTAQQIAQPILDMLPDLRGYSPSSHTGECPRPTIELYGTHVLDAHCTLIDDNKAIIQAAMLLAWALIALFIVLSA